MRRSSLPTDVSPGSKVSRTASPRSTSQSCSRRDWVDLPAPSPPSKHTKSPVSENTPALVRGPRGVVRGSEAEEEDAVGWVLTSHTLRAGAHSAGDARTQPTRHGQGHP